MPFVGGRHCGGCGDDGQRVPGKTLATGVVRLQRSSWRYSYPLGSLGEAIEEEHTGEGVAIQREHRKSSGSIRFPLSWYEG